MEQKKIILIQEEIKKSLLKKRKIFLWGEINNNNCLKTIEKLIFLEGINSKKEIQIYLNTPGGSITSGIALYDTMKNIQSPIKVIVTGMAASMGSIILCGASSGKRYLYPNSRILIHQPLISGEFMAAATDIKIQSDEIKNLRKELNIILSKSTGHSIQKIEKDTDRDFYLNANEAIQYGIADHIVLNKKN
jgi:ATP-dependent Clp protease protease subunit